VLSQPILLVVFDSVSYSTLKKSKPENISELGEIHKAIAHADWTLPSFASMFVGALPSCVECEKHRKIFGHSPFFLKEMNAVVFTSNSWIEVLAKKLGAKVVYSHSEYSTALFTHLILNLEIKTKLVVLHIMETHFSRYKSGGEKQQIQMIKHVDSALGKLFEKFDKVIVTSDHGENFGKGEKHGNFDGIFRKKIFEVFIVTKGW